MNPVMGAPAARISAIAAAILMAVAWPRPVLVGQFDMLWPDVVVGQDERVRLDNGESVVRVAAGRDGFLALTAVVRLTTTPERFLAWTSSVELLQKGKYIPEIGRFSATPQVADLNGLSVDPEDLSDLSRCRTGDCGVKLSEEEMTAFVGRRKHAALDALYREVLVRRAGEYLLRGDACQLPYDDHRNPVHPQAIFGELLQRLPFFPRALRCYADYLRSYPQTDGLTPQSFLYWSKETLGMKPIISITHFSAARFDQPGLPEVVVVGKQVYASHYKNASVTVTALVREGGARYLVYLNRSHVDAFHGTFGNMVRRVVERRVKAEAPSVLEGLRHRLESADPPA
jgi:hypothetical protein